MVFHRRACLNDAERCCMSGRAETGVRVSLCVCVCVVSIGDNGNLS